MENEQPLEQWRWRGKTKEIEKIIENLPGKEVVAIGDSITKNSERFAPRYPDFFPTSTELNGGITGNTLEEVLYRVEAMNIHSSVSHVSLISGNNNVSLNSPATISLTVIEILFCLPSKCPNDFIHVFPILIISRLIFPIVTVLFILRFTIFFRLCSLTHATIIPVQPKLVQG